MRVTVPIFFLTLVLNSLSSLIPLTVWAAPTTKTTLEPVPLNSQPDPILQSHTLGESLPIHELNVSVGYAGGNFLEKDQWQQAVLINFRYSPLDINLVPRWDVSAGVNKDNLVDVFFGHRWFVSQDDYRPFLHIAAGSFFNASSELGNIVELKRWRIRGSAGIGEKITFEIGWGMALTGPDMFALWGYNFNF